MDHSYYAQERVPLARHDNVVETSFPCSQNDFLVRHITTIMLDDDEEQASSHKSCGFNGTLGSDASCWKIRQGRQCDAISKVAVDDDGSGLVGDEGLGGSSWASFPSRQPSTRESSSKHIRFVPWIEDNIIDGESTSSPPNMRKSLDSFDDEVEIMLPTEADDESLAESRNSKRLCHCLGCRMDFILFLACSICCLLISFIVLGLLISFDVIGNSGDETPQAAGSGDSHSVLPRSLAPTYVTTHPPSVAPITESSKDSSPTWSVAPSHSTVAPTSPPTIAPTTDSAGGPSLAPTHVTTSPPSIAPTTESSSGPSLAPTHLSTSPPSIAPTTESSRGPSLAPTHLLTSPPSIAPTAEFPGGSFPNGTAAPTHSSLPTTSPPSIAPTPKTSVEGTMDKISVDRSCYSAGNDEILVEFNVDEPQEGDWIGIYEHDTVVVIYDYNAWSWSRSCGSQNCRTSPKTNSFYISTDRIEPSERIYRAFYNRLEPNLPPFDSIANSETFEITSQCEIHW
eukprot:scaffold22589_cov138-Cylindrotheca_fusiformis.AAC.22